MRVVLGPTVEVVVIEGVLAMGVAAVGSSVVLLDVALFRDDRLQPTPPPIVAPTIMSITTVKRI
jgi:hypothetical protein